MLGQTTSVCGLLSSWAGWRRFFIHFSSQRVMAAAPGGRLEAADWSINEPIRRDGQVKHIHYFI